MKTKLVLPLLLIPLIFVTSCSTIKGIFGKNASKEDKQAGKIEAVQKAQNQNNSSKMEQVAVLASGTDYALNKVTNKEPAIDVAQDINHRVQSLAGQPDLDAQKEMWKTVDNLTSSNATLRAQGVKDLDKKDKEIKILQDETKILLAAKDVEIDKYMKLSAATAMKADTLQVELNDYQGWFGLKAVGKGLWQFVKSMTWFLLGGSIIFIVLRFASMSNPIAASIFSVFEHMVSWVINTISVLFPKAINMAGHVSQDVYKSSQLLLKKIVDSLQNLKELQTRLGHDVTLKELFVELDKSMDASEKEAVAKVKKELGY